MYTFNCPLCSTLRNPVTVKPTDWKGTYIWSCPECPFISLEYYNDQDIEHLKEKVNDIGKF